MIYLKYEDTCNFHIHPILHEFTCKNFRTKKNRLKKAFQTGAITKIEHNKSEDYLKNLDKDKEKKLKNINFVKQKPKSITQLESFFKKKNKR